MKMMKELKSVLTIKNNERKRKKLLRQDNHTRLNRPPQSCVDHTQVEHPPNSSVLSAGLTTQSCATTKHTHTEHNSASLTTLSGATVTDHTPTRVEHSPNSSVPLIALTTQSDATVSDHTHPHGSTNLSPTSVSTHPTSNLSVELAAAIRGRTAKTTEQTFFS